MKRKKIIKLRERRGTRESIFLYRAIGEAGDDDDNVEAIWRKNLFKLTENGKAYRERCFFFSVQISRARLFPPFMIYLRSSIY